MQITIDPGTNGTGYAVWNKSWDLITHGVITSPEKTWEEKMYGIGGMLRVMVRKYNVTKAFIEEPQKFHGTFGNMVANRGDLVKLAMFVGYVKGSLGILVESVKVIDWKGTLPKDIVEQRVNKVYPKLSIKSHAIDAVGIGLYLSGHRMFK